MARVGETTMDSRATIPLVDCLRSKLHCGALGAANTRLSTVKGESKRRILTMMG